MAPVWMKPWLREMALPTGTLCLGWRQCLQQGQALRVFSLQGCPAGWRSEWRMGRAQQGEPNRSPRCSWLPAELRWAQHTLAIRSAWVLAMPGCSSFWAQGEQTQPWCSCSPLFLLAGWLLLANKHRLKATQGGHNHRSDPAKRREARPGSAGPGMSLFPAASWEGVTQHSTKPQANPKAPRWLILLASQSNQVFWHLSASFSAT